MVSYKFVVRKERNNSVMLRITANRKSSELSLGISVPSEILDEAVAGIASKEYKEQALAIKHYKNVIRDFLNKLSDEEQRNISASAFQKMIKEEVSGRRNPGMSSQKGNLVSFFKKIADSRLKPQSRKTYTYSLKHIEEFCKDEENEFFKNPNQLDFKDITVRWLEAFDVWMKKKGIGTNSRWLYMTRFRAVFNKAIDDELVTKDPFRRFKIKKEETLKRSLPVEDLRRFFNHPATEAQKLYLDMFKLTFMLIGINGIDLYGLKRIRNGRIEYRRAKTGRLYSIKVEPEAMEIIERWRGENGLLCLSDKWGTYEPFARLMVDMLKRMGRKADGVRQLYKKNGVRKKIDSDLPHVTSYWARHTWATIAADLDISDATISLALGHKSATNPTTAIYIKRNLKKVDAANRRVLDYVLYGKS